MSFGFGGAPQSSQSVFGAPASSQSFFGAQQSYPSLFGGGPSSQSLSGAPQSYPSLFGTPLSDSSAFGTPQSSQSPFNGPQSSQSLFGAPQSSQSLFGAPQSSQSLFGAPQSSQSLFGAQQSYPSLFGGSQSSQSLFGASQSSQSLFGALSTQSLFASSQSLFGAPQSAPSLFQQQQPQQPPQLPRNLTNLIEKLNPLHPDSSFHTFLYNLVPPSDVTRYARPQAMDATLWDKAQANNPDPSRLVPVQANLFDDLLQRADIQTKRIQSHGAVLSQIETLLTNTSENINTDIKPKLDRYRRRHRELARKLLRIACRVEAAASASGLTTAEIDRKRRLKTMASALNAPAEFKDKLADLVELADATVLGRSAATPAVEIRDARAANLIRELLSDQLKGIEQLSKVCGRADRDIVVMGDALEQR